MEKKIIKVMTFFYVMFFITSCDRPTCENTNPIFNKYSPDTKEYKDELVKQLNKVDKSKLTYWMDTYQEINDSRYISVYTQGDSLCAKIILKIDSSENGIERILEKKGISYCGAELEDLKFDIKKDSISTEFVFQEISGIID